MALGINDLISPKGKLQPAFFPDGDMTSNVAAWLSEAVGKVANVPATFQEAATKDWVYYRAYGFVAERMASEPDAVSVDDVQRSISQKRIEFFQNLAREHLDNFKGYTASTAPASGAKPASGYVQTTVVF